MANKKKMVMGVFRDRYDAERAFDYLYGAGYLDSEINLLMSDRTRSAFTTRDEKSKHEAGSLATEGVGVGGAIGTAVGATIAAVAAVGTTLAIPGLGLVIAGPVAAALAGGGAGAVTGGLIGGLAGLGMTEQNASAYEEALKNGGVVIGVTPERNYKAANEIQEKFSELNGENVCYC